MKILYFLSLIFIYFTILNAQTIKEECIWWVDYSADKSVGDGSFEKPFLELQDAIDEVVNTNNKCGNPNIKEITRIIYVVGGSQENVYSESLITISDVIYQFPILIQAVDKPENYIFNNSILPFNPSNFAVFVGKPDHYTINFQSSLAPFTVRGIEFRDGGYSKDLIIQSSIIVGRSTVSFDNCRFINNVGGSNGALHYNSLFSSNITNCLFENNVASSIDSQGGAITFPYVFARASMSNVTFRNNSASNGGAVWCNHQILIISDSLFENNIAIRGGALYTYDIPRQIDNIWSNIIFRNNSAQYGGGLYDFGSSNKYSHLLFELNNATIDGGATYLNNSVISVIFTNFNSNNALNGGAVYAKDIEDSLKVSQLLIKDSNFTLNTATNGGALYCIDAIARFNANNLYATSNMASNTTSSSNIDYCLSSCVTSGDDCGCPGGCGIPKKDNNPNSNAKIAVAIFLPITLILLGIVGFLLWKTHSKSKSFRTKVAPYDEIRLSPASQDTDDQL